MHLTHFIIGDIGEKYVYEKKQKDSTSGLLTPIQCRY